MQRLWRGAVSGLTIILVAANAARMRAALTMAISTTALEGRARLYCHERAVSLLVPTLRVDDYPADLARDGLPDRVALLGMAIDQRVELWACQTGLAMTGLTMAALIPGAQAGGMMALLSTLARDQLVTL